jgi:hypothetical protein
MKKVAKGLFAKYVKYIHHRSVARYEGRSVALQEANLTVKQRVNYIHIGFNF